MTAHVSATPVNVRSLRSEVPLELERLVAAMLRKRPEERPQQPGEVAKKLIEFARGCELKELVQRAETPTLSPASKIETDSKLQELDKPKTQSFLHRPVRLYKAIAAGFFGMVVGLCLGIIITITNPDGSKTTITIPDGSKVEFAESGKPTNTQSGQTAPNESSLSGSPQRAIAPPLQFALLVNRESSGKAPYISDKELANMIEQLPRTNSNAVVQNDFAKFVRVAEDPGSEFPISAWNNGYQYALISTDPKFSIGWDEIEGRILESKSTTDEANKETVLSLTFDKTLGAKMKSVSTAGMGQKLAIMVESTVVQSPKIASAIGTKVQISGIFSPSQLQNMRQYFSRSQSTTTNAIESSTFLDFGQPDARKATVAAGVKPVADRGVSINIDLVQLMRVLEQSMEGKRSGFFDEKRMGQLATKIAVCAGWANSETLKEGIRKARPFRGIVSVKRAIKSEAIQWLCNESDTVYTINISPREFFRDVETLVDSMVGPGALENILEGFENDPEGPKINFRLDVLDHLGDDVVVVAESLLVAFKLTDASAIRQSINRWTSLEDGAGPILISNYLVFGPKTKLDALRSAH